jgi:phage terminase large subunit-like protein
MPSFEPTFRNLILNQRVEAVAPFISRSVWEAGAAEPDPVAFEEGVVYGGLDLSGRNDLTALELVAWWEGRWHVRSVFWTPLGGLKDRARRDRAPYDIWVDQGYIRTTPGASIDYESVARDLVEELGGIERLAGVAFDRWRMDLLLKEFERIGAEFALFPFGQGFKDMAPAIDTLEGALLNRQLAHGAHPVLTMCMANARIEKDPAGNRKLNKAKATGRIDGAVALAMAMGIAARAAAAEESGDLDGFVNAPLVLVT